MSSHLMTAPIDDHPIREKPMSEAFEFKVGDVVTLKSNSDPMTVCVIREHPEGQRLRVVWFSFEDKTLHSEELFAGVFNKISE